MKGLGPAPDRAVPLAFVADVDDPVLDDAAHHHLGRVLRMREGDRLTVGDGAGRFRAARLGAGGRCEAEGDVVVAPAPGPALTVGFALTKGEKPELAVQQLTEVGVDRIVPFVGERSVVRWDDAKSDRHIARLRAVARGAAAQSHRAWIPEVGAVTTFDEVVGLAGAALAHPDGEVPGQGLATLLVGPEGGWSAAEEAAPLPRVRLGPHVLRSATAAVVAGTFLVALRHEFVMPSQ